MATKKLTKEILSCIYLLINLCNGKRYVGQDATGDPENHRWKEHIAIAFKSTDSRPLYRAMRKGRLKSKDEYFGFSAEIIWRGPVEQLHAKEIYYIKKFRSFNGDALGDKSYNLTKGGEGAHGYKHTKAMKKKLSLFHKQRFLVPETKAAHVARMHTFAYSATMSAAQTRRYAKPAEHEKMRAAQMRRYASMTKLERAELSVVMSAAAFQRWENATPDQREIWAAAQKAGCSTPKARINSAKGAEARWRNMKPKERAALIAATKIGRGTPQARANASNGVKRFWQSMTTEERAAFTKITREGNRTLQARTRSAEGTRRFWSAMTAEERSAHYQATHPNGNGREASKTKKPK